MRAEAIWVLPAITALVDWLAVARGDRRTEVWAKPLVLSSLIEMFLSALLAPILMLIQSGSVFQILLGRDTGWQPQRRDDRQGDCRPEDPHAVQCPATP